MKNPLIQRKVILLLINALIAIKNAIRFVLNASILYVKIVQESTIKFHMFKICNQVKYSLMKKII